MRLVLNVTRWMPKTYDYVPTRFDNGVKYGVWENGKAPLNARDNDRGTYLGQIARKDPEWSSEVTEWYVASRYGDQDADKLNWHGPFRTRKEATMYLSGYVRVERAYVS